MYASVNQTFCLMHNCNTVVWLFNKYQFHTFCMPLTAFHDPFIASESPPLTLCICFQFIQITKKTTAGVCLNKVKCCIVESVFNVFTVLAYLTVMLIREKLNPTLKIVNCS